MRKALTVGDTRPIKHTIHKIELSDKFCSVHVWSRVQDSLAAKAHERFAKANKGSQIAKLL